MQLDKKNSLYRTDIHQTTQKITLKQTYLKPLMHNQLARFSAMIIVYTPSTNHVIEPGECLLLKVWREIYASSAWMHDG